MVITNDIRLRTILALTGDAILRAIACLARGAVGVGTLTRIASEAARGARTNHIITLPAFDTKLRVRSAYARHACRAIRVRLLTW